MSRKPPEPHAARWANVPHLENYFAHLELPQTPDYTDGWPGPGGAYASPQEQERDLRLLLSSFLQVDSLDRPPPDPADIKSLYSDLDALGRMCEHFASAHESKARELRSMRSKVLERIAQWLSRSL